jgi:hypothetical protein
MAALGTRSLFGMAAALVMVVGSEPGFAIEPFDFGNTLQGATVGFPIAVPPPPGVYGLLETLIAPNASGVGQFNGYSVSAFLWAPELVWSSGYQILGGNFTMAVVQPFFDTAVYPTNDVGPPFEPTTIWTQNISNTIWTPALLQWRLAPEWFAAAGFTFIAPDGSRFNGTNTPDYWTFEPRAALAYITKDWHLSANFKYDFNTTSAGHSGAYQTLAAAVPIPSLAATIASFGYGYTSGQDAFLDLTAAYQYGKWEFGPIATFKWQTTSDTPGSGFTCAQVAAITTATGHPLPCGVAENYSLGGVAGYDFGPARLQVWVTDAVHAQDDFLGWAVYTRLTFKIWGPETPPMSTK